MEIYDFPSIPYTVPEYLECHGCFHRLDHAGPRDAAQLDDGFPDADRFDVDSIDVDRFGGLGACAAAADVDDVPDARARK